MCSDGGKPVWDLDLDKAEAWRLEMAGKVVREVFGPHAAEDVDYDALTRQLLQGLRDRGLDLLVTDLPT